MPSLSRLYKYLGPGVLPLEMIGRIQKVLQNNKGFFPSPSKTAWMVKVKQRTNYKSSSCWKGKRKPNNFMPEFYALNILISIRFPEDGEGWEQMKDGIFSNLTELMVEPLYDKDRNLELEKTYGVGSIYLFVSNHATCLHSQKHPTPFWNQLGCLSTLLYWKAVRSLIVRSLLLIFSQNVFMASWLSFVIMSTVIFSLSN